MLQDGVSQLQTNVQGGTIALLKLRALLIAAFPQVCFDQTRILLLLYAIKIMSLLNFLLTGPAVDVLCKIEYPLHWYAITSDHIIVKFSCYFRSFFCCFLIKQYYPS